MIDILNETMKHFGEKNIPEKMEPAEFLSRAFAMLYQLEDGDGYDIVEKYLDRIECEFRNRGLIK